MKLGTLCYVIDESCIDSLGIIQENIFAPRWVDDDKFVADAKKKAQDAIERARKDFSEIPKPDKDYSHIDDNKSFTDRLHHPDPRRMDQINYEINMEDLAQTESKINRILKRSLMFSKDKIDNILLKLKRFADRLELSPIKRKNANIFQKLKSLIGTAIRKLTNILMKKYGTNTRKGKITDADKKGIDWYAIGKNGRISHYGQYSPDYMRD